MSIQPTKHWWTFLSFKQFNSILEFLATDLFIAHDLIWSKLNHQNSSFSQQLASLQVKLKQRATYKLKADAKIKFIQICFKISFDQINQTDLESHFIICLVSRFVSKELWQVVAVQTIQSVYPTAVGEWQNDREFDGTGWIGVIELLRICQKVELFKMLDLSLVDASN